MSDENKAAVQSTALVNFLSDPTTLVALGVIAAGTAYYLATRPTPVKAPLPLDNQSIELPGGEHVRASHLCKNQELVHYVFEDARTLYECFQRGKRESGDGPCLGMRANSKAPYKWVTYGEVEDRARSLGAGLSYFGVDPGQDSFVGVYGPNNVDWVVTEQSCSYFSRVLVPLYDTLGPDSVAYILNQACMTVVVCHATKVHMLFSQTQNCPSLKLIVKMGGPITQEETEQAIETGIKIITMEEMERTGQENPVDFILPKPDDLCTICYTSGTTGNPKGVMLTHGNVIADVAGAYKQLEARFQSSPEDVHISYLPLAHMMERVVHVMLYTCGSRVGFFRGDVKELMNDIGELKPTIFISVPRLLNRVYDKVLAGAEASPIKKWLFTKAYNSKLSEVKRGIIRRNSMWDYLVFSKVQNLMGGRVRFILSGSAPISARVMDFLRVAFGCDVMEGYGQTECTAAATMLVPGDCSAGHVGPPLCNNFVKLVDIPDMNYFAASGEGEVCFKGPNVFIGYYKDPVKTEEALDRDGWLHSGDVGRWQENGTLKIIDRKKHIFKLAQGEYIAPEKVENIYVRCSYVAQTFLYGDSLKAACVAIVVPDEEVLVRWAANNGIDGTFFELCERQDVKKMILDDMTAVGKQNGLHSFELAKAIMLFPEGFTVENDLLTPTFKLRRPSFKIRFMQDFVQLYSKLPN